MTRWKEFLTSTIGAEATWGGRSGPDTVARFADFATEYGAIGGGPAVVDRSHRGLIEVAGKDRLNWLHNLTTNQVRTLGVGDGNYAFATNVKGRIVFDLHVLVRPEIAWLDVDRRFLEAALAHLERYIITEDVRLTDRTGEFTRLGLTGPAARDALTRLGAPHAANAPLCASTDLRLGSQEVIGFRSDFCGGFGVEFVVPAAAAPDVWSWLVSAGGGAATPAGDDAVHAHRIEAGIPWSGIEITDEVLPAETGQAERAVSFQKGCYLGQEVVERMRSRGSVGRLLRGLVVDGHDPPAPGTPLFLEDGSVVGVMTSACHSPALRAIAALGYVRSTCADPGNRLMVEQGTERRGAEVRSLPFVPGATG